MLEFAVQIEPDPVSMANGIALAQLAVRNFRDKHGWPSQQPLIVPKVVGGCLQVIAQQLAHEAEYCLRQGQLNPSEPAWERAHFLLEELAELFEAYAVGDEVELLDAITDLIYVLLGLAEVYDLPAGPAFAEVHRSNMTKQVGGLHPKGPGYQRPRLREVIDAHRVPTLALPDVPQPGPVPGSGEG